MGARSKKILRVAVITGATLLATVIPAVFSNSFSRNEETLQRSFAFSYRVTIPHIPRGSERIEISIPVPRSDNQQTVISRSVTSNLQYTPYTDPEYGNQVLVFEGLREADGLSALPASVEIQIDVTINRREASALQPHVMAGDDNPADIGRFLLADRLVPIDGRIAQEAREVIDDDMQTLEKARALYDHLLATMSYDKSGQGWGRGDAVYACDVRSGNCTDIHSLFIGMARSVGIPARFVIGFPLPPGELSGDIPGYHCWAEFYTRDLGWVPLDISEALNHPEKKEYYFGSLDPNRIAFTIGRDIQIETSVGAEELNFFIYPHTLLDGQPFDGANHKFTFAEFRAQQ